MSTQQRNPRTVAKKQRRDAARRRRAVQARRRQLMRVLVTVAAVAVLGAGFVWLVIDSRSDGAALEGVVDIDETGRNHVEGDVEYVSQPPAGGDHAPVWQNCGYYDQPVADENAVHSLEHGAVWIQYADDLDDTAKERIRQLTAGDPYLLASPFSDLPAPIVLSAWGKQLRLDDVDDPRVGQFLERFVEGPQTPEPGAICSGGVGEPAT